MLRPFETGDFERRSIYGHHVDSAARKYPVGPFDKLVVP
jgi:hypothetical protein